MMFSCRKKIWISSTTSHTRLWLDSVIATENFIALSEVVIQDLSSDQYHSLSKENRNPITTFKTPRASLTWAERGERGSGSSGHPQYLSETWPVCSLGAQECLSHSWGQQHQPGPGDHDLHSASSLGFKTLVLPWKHLSNLVRKIA